jgi:hypothetical protein
MMKQSNVAKLGLFLTLLCIGIVFFYVVILPLTGYVVTGQNCIVTNGVCYLLPAPKTAYSSSKHSFLYRTRFFKFEVRKGELFLDDRSYGMVVHGDEVVVSSDRFISVNGVRREPK